MWKKHVTPCYKSLILSPRTKLEPGVMAAPHRHVWKQYMGSGSFPMISIWNVDHWSINKAWPFNHAWPVDPVTIFHPILLVRLNLLNLKQAHGISWTPLQWFRFSMLIANTFTVRRLPWQRESWQRTPARAINPCVGKGYTNHLPHTGSNMFPPIPSAELSG